MKKYVSEFLRRGCVASSFGPIILAVLYLILQHQGIMETVTVNEVCFGILSLSALAFISGGMNVVYQMERLPLMVAIFIHGAVLYVSYLATYLINGWLEWVMMPVFVFSVIFAVGYLAVWAIIYTVTKRRTAKLNDIIRKKQWIAGK